jgi:hypothetical protein
MILIDLNQVLLAGLMAQISNQKNTKLDESLIRHMVLNIIRNHVKNFKEEYGDEVVLCCDNRRYWRKEYFPFYKAGRKKLREKSELDWNLIFDMLSKFKQELKDISPYKVIDVDGAEADDIIGTLVPIYACHQKILILSSDGDFLQLQQYGPNVKQYNPSLKKYIKSQNPLLELKEKIIRGDKGDGIPNMFSPADCFVREVKQKSVTKGILEKYLSEDVSKYNVTDTANFVRNSTLIDLSNIPTEIKKNIINTYDETKPAPRQKLLNYFIEHKLKNLTDVIEDF